MKRKLFSQIPKVDEVLIQAQIVDLLGQYPRGVVVEGIRLETEGIRQNIRDLEGNMIETFEIDFHGFYRNIQTYVRKEMGMKLKPVVNCTGVVLHTNMGRAVLSDYILDQVRAVSVNYSNLEFDLENGKRGSRYAHLEALITKLTGAESALVVNNNAAAVMLALNTLSKDKEVVVSRGELVEIGGSFRVPEVMKMSGAKLVEIGTTNKTHVRDYEQAITEDTGVLLKVHTSNYKITGFTQSVAIEDIAKVASKNHVPFVEDIGSGCLVDFADYGLEHEPLVSESIAKGADIVTFSGDKLLGGPQAGIIVGKKEYIDAMKGNQLTRALRVDKFTLSALEATLRIYLDKEKAIEEIPVLKMLTEKKASIAIRAQELLGMLSSVKHDFVMELIDGDSEVGGGSKPSEMLPTKLIAVTSRSYSVNKIWTLLKDNETPIITRINDDRLLIDVRTVKHSEYAVIRDAFNAIA